MANQKDDGSADPAGFNFKVTSVDLHIEKRRFIADYAKARMTSVSSTQIQRLVQEAASIWDAAYLESLNIPDPRNEGDTSPST
jgi:hypothetical protein